MDENFCKIHVGFLLVAFEKHSIQHRMLCSTKSKLYPNPPEKVGIIFSMFLKAFRNTVQKKVESKMKKRTPEDLRSQIRQGTMRLIAVGGMSNFSFPKLTATTGVVAPTIYELYKNKEDLLITCFLEIDKEIGQLLVDATKKAPPHRDRVEDVENYCWLLWGAYWRYLTANADRTLFYWVFYNSEYYKNLVIEQHNKNFALFDQYVAEIDRRFHISERCNIYVLITNLIAGTMSAAVKVIRGEFKNDDVTVNTIYGTVFQPILSMMDLNLEGAGTGHDR